VTGRSEQSAQQAVVLEAQRRGVSLLRNNSGAVMTDDGRMVRFGLGNESARINKHFKSSDLIGIHPVKITPEMVGTVIGVFRAVEMKAPGWRQDERSKAQARFGEWVKSQGGFFQFCTGTEDLE
jgi:hypothetical protein